MGMMELRREIIAAQELPPIPDTYQKVEYIYQNGQSSMFDTGINGDNDNLRFVFCVSPQGYSAYFPFFGNYLSETANGYRVMFGNANSKVVRSANTQINAGANIDCDASLISKKSYFDASVQKFEIVVNGEKKVNTDSMPKGSANDRNIAIGASYVRQSSSATPKAKWYYCKIYDNGSLIRFYIPCYRKADNVVGFYDVVGNTFNPSTGTGQFTLS